MIAKILLALFVAGVLAVTAAWAYLLTTICSNPRTPVPATGHVISYNCHGMTVFISPMQDNMLHWLIPIGLLFIVLMLLAVAAALLTAPNVRINVQVQVTDTSDKPNQ
ncbi:hypothetical protein [Pseudoduganella violaceinigra]|uniref:hypothetical protein n=1 Tax=Pseudoduganella violaceinigra TaxID=246602 RepID=UPI0012B63694|nr:hypothetical protein [Pseudoduganella violaceinigra]